MKTVSLDEHRKKAQAQQDDFWVRWGANARRMFPERGIEWAAERVELPSAVALIREGWETEAGRQLALN